MFVVFSGFRRSDRLEHQLANPLYKGLGFRVTLVRKHHESNDPNSQLNLKPKPKSTLQLIRGLKLNSKPRRLVDPRTLKTAHALNAVCSDDTCPKRGVSILPAGLRTTKGCDC